MATKTADETKRGALNVYITGLLVEFGQVGMQTANTAYMLNRVGNQEVLSKITDEGLEPKYRGSEWRFLSDPAGRLRFQIIDFDQGPVRTSPIKAFVIPVES